MNASLLAPGDLPPLQSDTAAAAAAALANRAYADLLNSGTAVTTSEYAHALEPRGIDYEAARARIKRDRARGRLITVTHNGEAILPTFQLEPDFEHSDLAADVVSALLDAGWGPWEIWDWAEAPNGWLADRTPSNAIRAHDAAAVDRALAAAVGPGPDA